MKKLFYFLLILAVANCSTKKLINKHGINNLELKKDEISIGKSNRNDIMNLLGPPSTVSLFDENIWIYIEIQKTNQSIVKLGTKKIKKNNTLIVEFDSRSLVKNIDFIDIQKMNNLEISKKITRKNYSKNSKLYNVLTSLREKINAPVKRHRQKK